MIFAMMNSLLFFTTITNLLILHFCAGILIHSVWMCTTPASAKLTSGWPRIIESIADSGEFLMPTGNSQPFLTLACKRVHVVKCQSTALPNCLIENRYGPIRVHNMMQGCSKTLACCKRLKDKLTVQGGGPMSLWGPNLPTSSSFTGPLPNRGGPSTYSRYGSILCSNEFC